MPGLIQPITPPEVVASCEAITKLARDRLASDENLLHVRGYHAYSTAVANLRFAIEHAMMELHNAIMEDN